MYFKKVLIILITIVTVFLIFYSTQFKTQNARKLFTPTLQEAHSLRNFQTTIFPSDSTLTSLISTKASPKENINIWCIFTKVRGPLKGKFRVFVQSLIKFSTTAIVLNILSDDLSKVIAKDIVNYVCKVENKEVGLVFYDIGEAARKIDDIVGAMMPHFSSQPGTYYSDALFYMSMGLHRIAPANQHKVIMLDCDIKFVSDVTLLYDQFHQFSNSTLFALSPELTPVYRHILYNYRLKHKNTTFGDHLHNGTGFPGYNSGVVLFNLDRIRSSEEYPLLMSQETVQVLVEKYLFKGHLGDQDYFTILGYEHPELIQMLPCEFNRQLCVWWRDHGYSDIFESYFGCSGNVKIYHGNCNTPIPNTTYFYNVN